MNLSNLFHRTPPTLPILFRTYHHKERDPQDVIRNIVPVRFGRRNRVYYWRFDKHPAVAPRMDDCSLAEFHKYFEEGE